MRDKSKNQIILFRASLSKKTGSCLKGNGIYNDATWIHDIHPTYAFNYYDHETYSSLFTC